ncbi:WEB family protein [Caenorhabditis elegans]|uniref:WEB family protein n=2 Tax=Caenorhabditis elegans TaxID=6239 RepID=A0A3B1DQH4_CAEEL|nr:WEB family protein [Caenorhabditis elegans]VAY52537.1 WEB family protein [Caenorhabditis elegans]|eukprot:NP_001355450.1 Uncharacterized protein CELE_ZK994.6 [Caenorhabditis elegans]
MVNYLPGAAHLPICRSRSEKKKVNHNNNDITSLFENKLAAQDKSMLNQTFTMGSNKEERCREFCIEDAINGFIPRARSSGPRSSMKNKIDENVRRVRSETASLFSSTCKLPQLDGSIASEKKTCTIRPWSRTQDELRKFKETLKSTTVSAKTATKSN